MPGGPISTDGGYLPDLPILVPTILQLSADSLSYWTSLTCLYDPYWSATEKMTLPVCMFHVTGVTETWSNEITKKRVILYEDPGTTADMSKPLRKSAVETIVDNIVKNPKTYSIEAVAPYAPVGRHVSEGVKGLAETLLFLAEIASGDPIHRDAIIGAVDATMGAVRGIMGAAEKLLDVVNIFAEGGAGTLNKNSLEAMADSGRTLCMKMWTGYDYKYVAITGLAIQKKPAEDGVFRVAMQLSEVPVLSVTEPTDLQSAAKRSRKALERVSGAVRAVLAEPIIGITGVRSDNAGGGVAGVYDAGNL
jgi:hypothetical protein